MDKKFIFWQKWLFVVSCTIASFGVLLVFINQTDIFNIVFNNQINPSFWHTKTLSSNITLFQQWVYGVLGATMAGMGVFMAFIIKYPFKNREKWAWNCIMSGMLLWYVLDTSVSIYCSVVFNAAFNTAILLLIMLPIVLTRKFFSTES